MVEDSSRPDGAEGPYQLCCKGKGCPEISKASDGSFLLEESGVQIRLEPAQARLLASLEPDQAAELARWLQARL